MKNTDKVQKSRTKQKKEKKQEYTQEKTSITNLKLAEKVGCKK